jgi:hypothetical protein
MSLPSRAELAAQLIRLVDVRLIDPLDLLLDGHDSLRAIRTAISSRAGIWAHRLLHGTDTEAAQLIARFVASLYPSDREFSPPADWWQTPLGRIVLWRVGHPGSDAVSYATAGAMLGITRQGVHDLVQRGKLLRHPDGGVVAASVRARFIATSAIDPGSNGSTTDQAPSEGRAHA